MPENVDVTVNAPVSKLPPVDPDIKIPASVRAAAERANSYYARAAEAPAAEAAPSIPAAPTASVDAAPTADGSRTSEVASVAAEPAAPEPPKAPAPAERVRPPVSADPKTPPKVGTAEHEYERYLAMKGRYDQSQKTIGTMQQQLQDLGDELVRTQQLLSTRPKDTQPQPPKQPLLTPEDAQTFGPELIDFAQRAAREALSPELEALRAENAKLKKHVSKTETHTINSTLDAQVPNWRDVNANPRWLQWLRLPDVYSGRVRQHMLNDATAAGDASRVVAFFKGFLAEEQATGHVDPDTEELEAAAPAPARKAAVDPVTLAAPGRPRPASSQPPTTNAADKPVITRAQISAFYANVRAGAYRGQDALKQQHEQMIFAAQREGRVR